jgi:hypothetical protein
MIDKTPISVSTLVFLSVIGLIYALCTKQEKGDAKYIEQLAEKAVQKTYEDLWTAKPVSQVTCEVNPAGKTICSRLQVPAGFVRVQGGANSFAVFLQNLPLKPDGTDGKNYYGGISAYASYIAGVVDIPIGEKNLLQCADAVMRLRADYLYAQGKKEEITFNFVSGFVCDYKSYAAGNRFDLKKNSWAKKAKPENSYQTYLNYLDLVYNYASTLSLEKELVEIADAKNIEIGNVFIRGGSPGHCFIVVDMVENKSKNKKLFALAQGFMPAQDIHLVKASTGECWLDLEKDYEGLLHYGELIAPKYLKKFEK